MISETESTKKSSQGLSLRAYPLRMQEQRISWSSVRGRCFMDFPLTTVVWLIPSSSEGYSSYLSSPSSYSSVSSETPSSLYVDEEVWALRGARGRMLLGLNFPYANVSLISLDNK